MAKSIASTPFLILICVAVLFWPPWAVAGFGVSTSAGSESAIAPSLTEKFKFFDGKTVSRLEFAGLVRTRERAIRWLIKTTEGHAFSSNDLALDLQTIYNTGNLYELVPTVAAGTMPDTVDVKITLKDKWTLLPVLGAFGGGGSLTFGGGIYDSNLLGYLINAQFVEYNFNGQVSYDLNFNQEYIAGTQTMAYLDYSNTITPLAVHNTDDSAAGQYSWARQQEEVMIGTHLPGPIRLMLIVDYYFDSLNSFSGVNAFVYPGNQYRLQPKVIIDRVNVTNYLEEGNELTLHPSTANFFGPVSAYQGFDASFKKVVILPHEANFGFFVFAGAMSVAPPPYEYQVGGYANIRGFSDNRLSGPYTTYANVEYRPLLGTHRYSFFGIDLVALQACVFSDAGSAWGDSTLTGDPNAKNFTLLWSAGAGLRLNFVHFAGAIMRIDLARTITPNEGVGLSFGVGQFF